jgi:hypothetical protein
MGDYRMAHQELFVDAAEEEAIRDDDGDTAKIDKVQLARRIKGWVKADSRHRSKWEKQAKLDFGFVACDQWDEEDKKKMEANGRVPVVFNRVLTIIKSICGSEINGRLETRYMPRGVEDTKQNELLSAASDWMSDQCDAEDEQSEAFESAVICGMGWTEARMDYDESPEGKYVEVEVDPFEMYWDCKATKKNLADARRITRIRRICISEARAMFPGVPDEDLDAAWADHASPGDDQKNPRSQEDQNHSNDDLDDPVAADRNDVTLVHCQWWEKEPYWMVALEPDPMMGMQQPPMEPEELSQEEFKQFEANAKKAKIRFQSAKLMRRVYKQAFVGAKILDYGPTPCPYEFSFQCITGERDRKNGQFFGFVRTMRDPQMWANKMLSNALHIANTTAKGGIIAEKNAFDDERQAEQSYAQPNEISWAAEGAVQHGRIMPKPGTGDPSVYLKLLEFSISSIRDASGVNLELLGLRDANQPGILEAQRKQAAMTVLASLFNSLRRFRKNIGRIRLHLIQEHMSDGRLIRIKGDMGPEVAQLAKDATAGEYDVIVADAPTSPNQKEQTWMMIQNILPVFKDMLTPDVTLALLEYSPFPTEVVEKLRTLKQQADQKAAQAAEEQKKLLAEDRQYNLQNLQAKTQKDQAAAQKTMVEAGTAQNQVQLGHVKEQADARKADADAMKSQADAQKSMADAEAARVQGRAAAMKTLAETENTRMQGEAAQMDAQAKFAEAQSKSMFQMEIDQAELKKIIAETTKTTIETMMMMQAQQHEQSMAEQSLQEDHTMERARFVAEQDQQQKSFEHQRQLDNKSLQSKNELAKKQLSQKAAAQKTGGTKK